MKVDATPIASPGAPVAPLPRDAAAVSSTAPAPEAPLPAVGAAKMPVNVAARLTGTAEKNLRATLAQLKDDVTPKALQLAVNKLATHARQDVHAALKAMLGGDADAVAKFVKADHFDFARAELKAIAAKLPARVVETTERVVDLQMGVIAGMTPVPTPALFDHAFEYELGQRMGAAVGLAADAAAIIAGSAMTGGGAAGAPATGGASLVVSQAGMALITAGAVGAAFHGGRLLHPLPPAVFETRASTLGESVKSLNEKHIFEGEVKDGFEKPTDAIKAERKRLKEIQKSRQLTPDELKVFENKPIRVAQGWHLESTGGENARIIESTRSAPDANGVYEGNVELLDPATGNWVRKKKPSTFFPAKYSRGEVREAVSEAFTCAIRQDDGAWIGKTRSGMKIVLVVDEGDIVVTAYPLREVLE